MDEFNFSVIVALSLLSLCGRCEGMYEYVSARTVHLALLKRFVMIVIVQVGIANRRFFEAPTK